MAGEADWLCAEKYCNLSAGKSPRAIIQKRDLKLVNTFAALAENFTCWDLKIEKMLSNRTHKIAAVNEQICFHALVFCCLFSYTILLASLGKTLLSFSFSMVEDYY